MLLKKTQNNTILKRHPRKVVGIDVSTKLLDIAKTRFPDVEFQKMEMTDLRFPDNSFNLIYSSLTFHYAKDWDILLSGIYRVLKENGELFFSTHHPVYWGSKGSTGNKYTNARGIVVTEHTAILPADIEITYYNHINEDAIREAVEHAGFKIIKSFAPSVIDIPVGELPKKDIVAYQKIKIKNEKMPLFFIIKAMKK
ncbi:MAG: class I SAM-dependent methyltransferase [Patescibacteria group bacterium]